MGSLKSIFTVDTSNIDLVRALLANFNRQVPLLYFVLCTNAVLCAVSLRDEVPEFLVVHVPATLVAVCLARMLVWLRARGVPIDDRLAVRRLKGVVLLGLVVGMMFLFWYSALFIEAKSALSRLNVVFSVTLMTLACMSCLLHLRAAARMLACVISMPVAFFLLITGDAHFEVLGVNMILVVSTMIYVTTITSRDFEKMIELGAANARLANVDSLTSLPNRRHFFDQLDQVLQRPSTSGKVFAVGVLDVDGFKSVNDVFGHVTGDRLLIEIGQRMQRVAGAGGMVARLGGDEFGILIEDARDPQALIACGERICAEVNQPIFLRGPVAHVSISIGFAVYPVAGANAELLYERADYALCHAKENKRGKPVLFSDVHEVEIRRRGQMEQCLRNADLDNELSLHFQPLVDVARGGAPTAFEALARWNSPKLGSVPPNEFIGIAERSDLIHRLTRLLLRKALKAVLGWPASIGISFNLSMRDIVSSDAIAQIVQIVRESGVAPSRIEFEITESALMADFSQAMLSVRTLRGLGTRISLDDFGTGYSSLSHVHRLPLDKIKIDRSFITDLETLGTGKDILRTVIDLCQNLGIQCVVEGTETAGQIDILTALGCNAMQGYYFARPMPLDQVDAYLAERARAERGLREAGFQPAPVPAQIAVAAAARSMVVV